MEFNNTFPRQMLPYRSKGKKWRESCVDFAARHTYFNYSPVRKNVVQMKINYDLLNGIIHMDDMAAVLNPGKVSTMFIPEKIQHYPIINSKINTLRGEEFGRDFRWRAIVTNPDAISEAEQKKTEEFHQSLQELVEDMSIDQREAEKQMEDISQYYNYSWQDQKEIRDNQFIKHYSKQQNWKQMFNDGFVDACSVSNEIYICDIEGGEPVLHRMNPLKIRALMSGYSNHIEDADMIIYEDYWSRGRIVDTFYDELSADDIKRLHEDITTLNGSIDNADNFWEAYSKSGSSGFVGPGGTDIGGLFDSDGIFDNLSELPGGLTSDLSPYDVLGNIRVIRVWWKSLRKIYSVKSYDPETGEEVFDFYPETYVPNKAAGEEATVMWVNEAWEGTLIGKDIYVRIRPCLVQHNTIDNPSKCHFGIVGTIYNVNESLPFSLVDMMKPYSYLYDAIHAKLVDLIATNWGKLLEMDLAFKPKNWKVEQWLYFARANKVLIKDSFNEGAKGAATGKLAGGLNNATKGYIDADWGNSIQNYIQLLQWTKDAMSDLVGINRQREGNTYNRETVGGIERAVLQSSYITDWIFQQHEDTKRRALDCFLDVAKAAFRGRTKTFQYILSDGSIKVMKIDGDEFAEYSSGIIVDNSQDTQKLESSLDAIAQAAMQNQQKLSTIMKLYTSASIQEKMRLIEADEKQMQRQQQEEMQRQQELQQQQIQAQMQTAQMEMQQKDLLNQRDNQTKIEVAQINAQAENLRLAIYDDQNNIEIRKEEMDIDREKLRNEILALDKEIRFKEKELDQKKELEMKKIEAQKQIANKRKA